VSSAGLGWGKKKRIDKSVEEASNQNDQSDSSIDSVPEEEH